MKNLEHSTGGSSLSDKRGHRGGGLAPLPDDFDQQCDEAMEQIASYIREGFMRTPGSWSLYKLTRLTGIYSQSGAPIAKVNRHDDAVLMRAAPELVDELSCSRDALDSVLTWGHLSDAHRKMITDRVNAIELALAKATGKA